MSKSNETKSKSKSELSASKAKQHCDVEAVR